MSGAWAITEQEEALDVEGIKFEGYTFYPNLAFDEAIAVFVLPDNQAFLAKVTMLGIDGKDLLCNPGYEQTTDRYRTRSTIH